MDAREDELVEVAGYVMTSPLRTARDLALDRTAREGCNAARPRSGLAARRLPHTWVRCGVRRCMEAVVRLGPARGTRRARFAAEFADARSESPGESLSRVQLHRLRMPRPQLQIPVPKPWSGHWDVDFGWEEYALFGEFDGYLKYHREDMTAARLPKTSSGRKRNARTPSGTHQAIDDSLDLGHRDRPAAFQRLLLEAGLRPRPRVPFRASDSAAAVTDARKGNLSTRRGGGCAADAAGARDATARHARVAAGPDVANSMSSHFERRACCVPLRITARQCIATV